MKMGNQSYTVRWLLVALALLFAWTSTLAVQVPGPLVDTGWLADNEGEVVVLDVRKDASSYLGKPPGPSEKPNLKKLVGHIPGAISVPWKKVVAKGEEQGIKLKGMLPTPAAFTELMQASGVNKDGAAVIAGRGSSTKDQAFATRLYFSMKYFGHDNLALLNGGTAQWAKEGRPLEYTAEKPAKGDFAVAEIRKHMLASTQDVENAIRQGDVQLVDCRTEDFFLGVNYKRKFVSPEHKGHLPGARTLPSVLVADNWGPAKLFSSDEIRKLATLKGVDLTQPTITYCNTGVVATLPWFVLHELEGNQQTRLYDGSMHAWSNLSPEPQVIALADVAEEQAARSAETTTGEAAEQTLALPRPPRSLQSLVDERRAQFRQRRERYFDAFSGRHFLQPPWMIVHDEMMDTYRDRMREAHRQYRDASRLQHDAYRSLYMPWSQAFHDSAEARFFALQMEQLDREEVFDNMRFGQVYGPVGLFRY